MDRLSTLGRLSATIDFQSTMKAHRLSKILSTFTTFGIFREKIRKNPARKFEKIARKNVCSRPLVENGKILIQPGQLLLLLGPLRCKSQTVISPALQRPYRRVFWLLWCNYITRHKNGSEGRFRGSQRVPIKKALGQLLQGIRKAARLGRCCCSVLFLAAPGIHPSRIQKSAGKTQRRRLVSFE